MLISSNKDMLTKMKTEILHISLFYNLIHTYIITYNKVIRSFLKIICLNDYADFKIMHLKLLF